MLEAMIMLAMSRALRGNLGKSSHGVDNLSAKFNSGSYFRCTDQSAYVI